LDTRPDASERFYTNPGTREGDDRSPFEEDRDVVLYSSAFKRLLSVTQVTSGSAGYLLHTRLTHSLQVAQVGRRLSEKLLTIQPALADFLGVNPDVVETACLAHDIGHPPFGHLSEERLDHHAASIGGFEGNAQSFRVVTRLAIRSKSHDGLNLTRGSLRAILKYPWVYSKRPTDDRHPTGLMPKWGAYDSDKETFDWIWKEHSGGPISPRAPEAELMDWADDVTYSVHDVEDFFRAGRIPLDLLQSFRQTGNRKERDRFFEYVMDRKQRDKVLAPLSAAEIEKIFDDLLLYAFLFEQPYEGTRADHANLRIFTSRLINRFINAVRLKEPDSESPTTVEKNELQEQEVAILKQLTWYYVIDAPGLAVQREAQKKIVDRLAIMFLNEVTQKRPSGVLPISLRDFLKTHSLSENGKLRAAIDLIASMTESQAIELFQRIEGISLGSALDKILV
jgi:dGTPase